MSAVYFERDCFNCGGDGSSNRFMDSTGEPCICMDCDGAGTTYVRLEPVRVIGAGRGPAWFTQHEEFIPAPTDWDAE